ncbi:MAG: alpha-E domain-containing protein, partial [Actinobacteria bacterium HGW-Actinobacteria-8]
SALLVGAIPAAASAQLNQEVDDNTGFGTTAAEFLLIDRQFPRSIAYNLDKAEVTLTLIEPGLSRHSQTDQARLALGRARTNLEYEPIDEILADLPAQMRHVQQACATAADIIRDRFFLPSSSVLWSQEAV